MPVWPSGIKKITRFQPDLAENSFTLSQFSSIHTSQSGLRTQLLKTALHQLNAALRIRRGTARGPFTGAVQALVRGINGTGRGNSLVDVHMLPVLRSWAVVWLGTGAHSDVNSAPCRHLAQLAASAPRTVEELQGLVISGVSELMKRQYGELVVR